jgi:tetratricopeptide (TPR) repeat protein
MTLQPIYLAYRRSLSAPIAAAIYRELVGLGWDIFAERSSTDATWLEDDLRRELRLRPHFLLLLQADSLRRCSDPSGDALLKEIEVALEWGKNVVLGILPGCDLRAEGRFLSTELRADLFRQPQVPLTPAAVRPMAERYFGPQSLPIRTHGPSTPAQAPYFQRGVARLSGDPAQLLIEFTQDVEAAPQNVEAYFFRGLVYARQGNFKRAIEDYSKALLLAADFSAGYARRASAYAALGQPEAAIQDYRQALALRHVPSDYVALGRLLLDLGRVEEALEVALDGVGRYGQAQDSEELADLTVLYLQAKGGRASRPLPKPDEASERPSSRLAKWLGGQ